MLKREKTKFSLMLVVMIAFALTFFNCGSKIHAATNLLSNPGFEDGNADWTIHQNAGYVTSNYRSGSQAMRVGTDAGGVYQKVTSVNANTDYNISGWGKVAQRGEIGWVIFKCFDSSDNLLNKGAIKYTTTTYSYNSLNFTTPDNTSYVKIWGWKDAGQNSYFYLDDLSLEQKVSQVKKDNLVKNWDFQLKGEEWESSGSAGVVSSNSQVGTNSMRIGTASGKTTHKIERVYPEATYKLSVWGKVSTSGEKGYIEAKIYDSSNNEIKNHQLTFESTSYEQNEYYLTAPSAAEYVEIEIRKNSGSGYFYADGINFIGLKDKLADPSSGQSNYISNMVENKGFESAMDYWEKWSGTIDIVSSNVRSGDNAVRIGENGGTVAQEITYDVAPNTYYKIGGWGQYSESGGNAYLRAKIYDAGWDEITSYTTDSFTATDYEYKETSFTTPANAAHIYITIEKESGGSQYFYADDITFKALDEANVYINVNNVVNDVSGNPLGINTNFLNDHDFSRQQGQGLKDALVNMGITSLRYPGGEKSDDHLWATSPFSSPNSQLARTGPLEWPYSNRRLVSDDGSFLYDPMDFDEFMDLTSYIGAEPYIVLNYDSANKPATYQGTKPSLSELKTTAVEWVDYAKSNGYDITYWEIGNETYYDVYNGYATASEYASTINDWAPDLKAKDSTIKIGANGPSDLWGSGEHDLDGTTWWKEVLQNSASKIDFMSIHTYPCYEFGSYDYYKYNTPNFAKAALNAEKALDKWAGEYKDNIEIAITEINAADWSKKWPLDNDLGHALVLFDLLSTQLKNPKVSTTMVWNTRWVSSETEVWDALNENNEHTPIGEATSILGKNLEQKMVYSASSRTVRSFASYDPNNENLTLFLINKKDTSINQTIELDNFTGASSAERWVFTGNSPTDTSPSWSQLGDVSRTNQTLTLDLDPLSITVLKFN